MVNFLWGYAIIFFAFFLSYLKTTLVFLEENFLRVSLSAIEVIPAASPKFRQKPSLTVAFSGSIHLSFFKLALGSFSGMKLTVNFTRLVLPRFVVPHINATVSDCIESKSPFTTATPLEVSFFVLVIHVAQCDSIWLRTGTVALICVRAQCLA